MDDITLTGYVSVGNLPSGFTSFDHAVNISKGILDSFLVVHKIIIHDIGDEVVFIPQTHHVARRHAFTLGIPFNKKKEKFRF